MAQLIAQTTGIKMTHVAYKGGTAMMPDLAAGWITFAVDTLKNMRPLVHAGSVRFLGVTNAERWPDLAAVPTFVESGYPEVALNSWIGVAAPSKTPPQILALLGKVLAEISTLPEVRKQLADLGINVLPQPLTGKAYRGLPAQGKRALEQDREGGGREGRLRRTMADFTLEEVLVP